jgi:hypothetical protein
MDDICGVNPIQISIMGITLADMFTTPLQMQGSVEYAGQPASYFLPLRPSKTYAEIETLLSSIDAESSGLVAQVQLGLVSLPASRALFEPCPTQSLQYSDIGHIHAVYHPFRDDTALTGDDFDGTTGLRWLQHYGFNDFHDALSVFRVATGGTSPVPVTIAAPAAGKLSISYADDGDTAFTVANDTNEQMKIFLQKATNQSEDWALEALPRQYQATVVKNETGWNNRMVSYLARNAIRHLYVPKGVPLLPDLVVRGKGGGLGNARVKEVDPKDGNKPVTVIPSRALPSPYARDTIKVSPELASVGEALGGPIGIIIGGLAPELLDVGQDMLAGTNVNTQPNTVDVASSNAAGLVLYGIAGALRSMLSGISGDMTPDELEYMGYSGVF